MPKKQKAEMDFSQVGFNTDLKLIRSLSAHKSDSITRRLRSFREVAALLKIKAQSSFYLNSAWDGNGRQLLAKKGIILQPLIAKVAELKKNAVIPQAGKVQKNNFHIQTNQQPITQHLRKAEDYANMTLMQSIMTKDYPRKKQTYKLMEMLLEEGVVYSSCQRQSTLEEKNAYIAITQQAIKGIGYNELDFVGKMMLPQLKLKFMNAQHNSLWQIFAYQTQGFNKYGLSAHNFQSMLINSYRLVQKEFQRKMHGKDFERYVMNQYIENIDSKYFEKSASYLWPKVWTAYCAGQVARVQQLLASDKRDQRELIQLFMLSEQKIISMSPAKHCFSPYYDIQDIFYEQFVYCVTGQSRFSSFALSNYLSLELIFITLRTLGIFYKQEQKKFEEFRSNIVSKYKDLGPNDQMVRNIMYLVDYETIVKLGPNTVLSKQDYLHLLIVLRSYPCLVNQTTFNKIYLKTLVSFIHQLWTSGRNEYIYYILLLPQNVQVQYTSAIILSVDGLETFNWTGLKEIMPEYNFSQIVVSTAEKYRWRGAYLQTAQKLQNLCYDYDRACHVLLSLCIGYHLKTGKHSKAEADKAQSLGHQWSILTSPFNPYQIAFQLVSSFQELLTLIIKRNQKGLRQFITKCQFINLNLDQLNSLYVRMLKVIHQAKGLQFYYHFLRLLIKGTEIYAANINDNERIQVIKAVLRKQVEQIQKLQFVGNQLQGYHLKHLRQELRDFIMNTL